MELKKHNELAKGKRASERPRNGFLTTESMLRADGGRWAEGGLTGDGIQEDTCEEKWVLYAGNEVPDPALEADKHCRSANWNLNKNLKTGEGDLNNNNNILVVKSEVC